MNRRLTPWVRRRREAIDGVEFNSAYKNKLSVDLDSIRVNYIGLSDFIQNKQTTGRARDLADIKDIQLDVNTSIQKAKRKKR